jgi:predicted nucleic acid-binding protein
MSIVTLAELLSGVAQSTKRTESESQLREFARGVQILGIDELIARTWGDEDARLSQAGTSIGDLDLFVAATALSHGLVVCTQNRKHFERVKGLKIESVELARKR